MRKVCFLSMDDLGGYVADDDLAIEPLRQLDWHVETLSWRQTEQRWSDFAAVVIRTPWDYQKYPREFLNASGNFVKVTQRVPVKIRIKDMEKYRNMLRAGLSVYISTEIN